MRIATLLPVSHIGILVAHFGSATSPYIGPLEYQILGYTGALPFPPSAVRPTSVLKGQLCRSEPDALLGPSPTLAFGISTRARDQYEVPCSIPSSLLLGCVRLVRIPTARGSHHDRQARGGFRPATPASSAEDERFDAMAHSHVDSANGTSILR